MIVAVVGLLAVLSACTPQQAAIWRQWHRQAPADAEAFLDTDTYAELSTPAQASTQAERLDPPAPAQDSPGDGSSSNGRCVGYEDLLARYSPGWDVVKMSRIMYRESRCNAGAYNRSGATGLLQILKSHCGWFAGQGLGGCNLTNPSYNIRAAALLFQNGGYNHWAQTR
jgi:hypothetical protein